MPGNRFPKNIYTLLRIAKGMCVCDCKFYVMPLWVRLISDRSVLWHWMGLIDTDVTGRSQKLLCTMCWKCSLMGWNFRGSKYMMLKSSKLSERKKPEIRCQQLHFRSLYWWLWKTFGINKTWVIAFSNCPKWEADPKEAHFCQGRFLLIIPKPHLLQGLANSQLLSSL